MQKREKVATKVQAASCRQSDGNRLRIRWPAQLIASITVIPAKRARAGIQPTLVATT